MVGFIWNKRYALIAASSFICRVYLLLVKLGERGSQEVQTDKHHFCCDPALFLVNYTYPYSRKALVLNSTLIDEKEKVLSHHISINNITRIGEAQR